MGHTENPNMNVRKYDCEGGNDEQVNYQHDITKYIRLS